MTRAEEKLQQSKADYLVAQEIEKRRVFQLVRIGDDLSKIETDFMWLGTRIGNSMRRENVKNMLQFYALTKAELRLWPNLGRSSVDTIVFEQGQHSPPAQHFPQLESLRTKKIVVPRSDPVKRKERSDILREQRRLKKESQEQESIFRSVQQKRRQLKPSKLKD